MADEARGEKRAEDLKDALPRKNPAEERIPR